MSSRSFCGTHKMVFLLQMIAEATAANLYADKIAFYCFTKITSKKIFDGVKNKHNMEIFNEVCPSKAFIQIHLGGMFSINYVIIFEGNTQEQLDFFVVQRNNLTTSDACGEYPGKGNSKILRGFRVNCKTVANLHTGVTITSLKNRGFYIAEIELHSFGTGLVNESFLIYRGCFREFGKNEEELNFKSCHAKCRMNGFQFAGIKENKVCACGNSVVPHTEISYVECGVKCDDVRKECGGPRSYSVYLIKVPLPFFVGCFKSSENNINLTTTAGEMTIAKCLQACDSYKYAVLQDGNVCVCRDDIIMHDIVATNMCTLKCIGDPSFYCGGRNLDSVYSTCYQEDQEGSVKCSELLNCAGSYDAFGSCDACKVGFFGEYCLERAKFFKPGEVENVTDPCEFSNPCLEIRNSFCVVTAENVLCECMIGYTKNRDESECEDIDECKFEPCYAGTSYCLNLNGSYACKCKSGSNMVADDICVVNITKAYEYSANLEYYLKKTLAIMLPLISFIILILVVRYEAPWLGSETITSDASIYAVIDGPEKLGDKK